MATITTTRARDEHRVLERLKNDLLNNPPTVESADSWYRRLRRQISRQPSRKHQVPPVIQVQGPRPETRPVEDVHVSAERTSRSEQSVASTSGDNQAQAGLDSQPVPETVASPAAGVNPGQQTAQDTIIGNQQRAPQQVPDFVQCGKNLFHATRLRPADGLIRTWNQILFTTIKVRLRNLHLGADDITTLELRMMGPKPEASCMKPTLWVICNESRSRDVQNNLAEYLRAIDLPVQLRVQEDEDQNRPARKIWKVVFSSGSSAASEPSEIKKGLPFEFALADSQSLMGCLARVLIRTEASGTLTYSPIFTIGGIIMIGGTLYGLSVAHSLFQTTSVPTKVDKDKKFTYSGKLGSYKWSGNGAVDEPMDWLLCRVGHIASLPNRFVTPDWESRSTSSSMAWLTDQGPQEMQEVPRSDPLTPDLISNTVGSSYLPTSSITDGDVWVCAGRSGTQKGYVNSAPAMLMYGDVFFDVRTISLEHSLDDGDSGSWVIQNGQVCGYIFARVDGQPWAYMLPIQPVIEDIQRLYSTDDPVEVRFPSEEDVERCRPQADYLTQSLIRTRAPVRLKPAESEVDEIAPIRPSTSAEISVPDESLVGKARARPVPSGAMTSRDDVVPSPALADATPARPLPETNVSPRPAIYTPNQARPLNAKISLNYRLGMLIAVVLVTSGASAVGIYFIVKRSGIPVYGMVLSGIAISLVPLFLIIGGLWLLIPAASKRCLKSALETMAFGILIILPLVYLGGAITGVYFIARHTTIPLSGKILSGFAIFLGPYLLNTIWSLWRRMMTDPLDSRKMWGKLYYTMVYFIILLGGCSVGVYFIATRAPIQLYAKVLASFAVFLIPLLFLVVLSIWGAPFEPTGHRSLGKLVHWVFRRRYVLFILVLYVLGICVAGVYFISQNSALSIGAKSGLGILIFVIYIGMVSGLAWGCYRRRKPLRPAGQEAYVAEAELSHETKPEDTIPGIASFSSDQMRYVGISPVYPSPVQVTGLSPMAELESSRPYQEMDSGYSYNNIPSHELV